MKQLSVFALLMAACATPGPSGGKQPETEFELAAGRAISVDDLTWSASLQRVLAAAPEVGKVFLVSTDFQIAETLEGPEMLGPTSADEGNGHIFVGDRATNTIHVFDAATRKRIGGATGTGPVDYVRYCAPTHEVWVSEPRQSRIEVFLSGTDGTLLSSGFIETAGGAEGLTIDAPKGLALTHAGAGKLVIIDVHSRTVKTVDTGCANLHGFPSFDGALGFAFAGCGSTAEVAVVDLAESTVKGRTQVAGHTTVQGYSATLHHLYLRADPGVPVTVLGVGTTGELTKLGTFDAQTHGHALAADAEGHLFVPDADRGRLLRFTDNWQ